jgi:hypothetical protein
MATDMGFGPECDLSGIYDTNTSGWGLRKISVEWMQDRGASVSAVIAGLDPAIHLFRKNFDAKKMDPRGQARG